jgi:hypothetical protein
MKLEAPQEVKLFPTSEITFLHSLQPSTPHLNHRLLPLSPHFPLTREPTFQPSFAHSLPPRWSSDHPIRSVTQQLATDLWRLLPRHRHNFHAYSHLWMSPWGYTIKASPVACVHMRLSFKERREAISDCDSEKVFSRASRRSWESSIS